MSVTNDIREAKRYRARLESQGETQVHEMTLDELERFIGGK